MKFITDRIYSAESDIPKPRHGEVVLDDDEMFADLRDTERIIHVTDGLRPLDVAVFLEFLDDSSDSQLERKIGGYVIGSLNSPYDGGGVLVSIDALAQYKDQLMTPEIDARLALLTDAMTQFEQS